MTSLDLIVRGGTVVNASGSVVADVGVMGGKIVHVGGPMRGRTEIDAEGLLVLPGGVDPHVHLSAPSLPDGPSWVDDFYTGSQAAIAGGITTIGNMTFQREGESLHDALSRDLSDAKATAAVDFLLHPVLTDPSVTVRASLNELASQGVRSVKVFLTNPSFDARIDEYMEAITIAASAGMLVLMHCEDGPLLRAIAAHLEQEGKTGVDQWSESRPDYVEASAVQRAKAIAQTTGASIYVVHVSSSAALRASAAAKRAGLPFYVETRPMYLHLTSERLQEEDGAKYIGAPPLRGPADSAALWSALQDGTVDTVATDHAPWALDAKLDPGLTFKTARQGVADLETSLPLLFSEGVRAGRLSLTRFVELVSARPAQLFGLWPRKGLIAPGSDADLAIWDPEYRYFIDANRMYSRADYSVYEGREVTGCPLTVIAQGQVVMKDRQVDVTPGRGAWLPASPPEDRGERPLAAHIGADVYVIDAEQRAVPACGDSEAVQQPEPKEN
jgi:dihydropyrimidinase